MEVNVAGHDALPRQPGVLGLLAGTLIRPRTVMVALRSPRWSWWGIPALLVVAAIVMSVVAYSHADCQYVHQLEMEHYRSSSNQMMSPPVAPKPLPITMAIRAGGWLVSTLGSWVVWAASLYLALILLGQSGIGFGSVWTLVLWAWMPCVVRSVLQTAYMMIVSRPIYNQGLSGLIVDRTPPPPMTFRYVIPTTNELALASLLSRFDVYLIWQLALMVMGVMALSKLPRNKAVALTCGLWIAFMLVSLIPSFFPGTFARFRYF